MFKERKNEHNRDSDGDPLIEGGFNTSMDIKRSEPELLESALEAGAVLENDKSMK